MSVLKFPAGSFFPISDEVAAKRCGVKLIGDCEGDIDEDGFEGEGVIFSGDRVSLIKLINSVPGFSDDPDAAEGG